MLSCNASVRYSNVIFGQVPSDVFKNVLVGFLDTPDLVHLGSACKQAQELCNDDLIIWKPRYERLARKHGQPVLSVSALDVSRNTYRKLFADLYRAYERPLGSSALQLTPEELDYKRGWRVVIHETCMKAIFAVLQLRLPLQVLSVLLLPVYLYMRVRYGRPSAHSPLYLIFYSLFLRFTSSSLLLRCMIVQNNTMTRQYAELHQLLTQGVDSWHTLGMLLAFETPLRIIFFECQYVLTLCGMAFWYLAGLVPFTAPMNKLAILTAGLCLPIYLTMQLYLFFLPSLSRGLEPFDVVVGFFSFTVI